MDHRVDQVVEVLVKRPTVNQVQELLDKETQVVVTLTVAAVAEAVLEAQAKTVILDLVHPAVTVVLD